VSVPASLQGIYNQLFPPEPRQQDQHFDRLKALAGSAISPRVPELEKLLGLQQRNVQFEDDLVSAISSCIWMHNFPPKRPGDKRKELLAISKGNDTVAQSIRQLNWRVGQSSSLYDPVKQRLLELGSDVDDREKLSQLCLAHARALRDGGGRKGMLAFRVLVQLLCDTFERATGGDVSETAKYRGQKQEFEGVFFEFVDSVLRIVRERVPRIACPESRLAQDTYVFKVVSSLRPSENRKERRKRAPRPGKAADRSRQNLRLQRRRRSERARRKMPASA
jgi:hypothetical protein